MRRAGIVLGAASVLILGFALAFGDDEMPDKVLRFGKLVDGTGRVLSDALVVVEGGRIASVGTDPSPLSTAREVIDLRRYTGIPGLIDVHTHMTYYWDRAPGTRPWQQLARRASAVTVFLAQENARLTLEAGVTAVRDLYASEYADIAMRNLIDRGAMPGPRMFVSGYGLHVTLEARRPGFESPSGGEADGVGEIRRVVREQIAAGADWVKMFGSTGSGADVTGHQTFSFDEMEAAAETAHHLGRKIAIHSYGPDGARDAVRAGADSVEHAVDLDAETMAEMARRGIFYVPTIDHNRYYLDHRQEFGYGPEVEQPMRSFIQRNLETVRRAHRAGVRIAMGSDAVFTMFGENTRELAWFVKAGMSPAEALATATTNAAELLGMEDSLGAVAAGYYADLVAVEGDPLADIDVVIDKVRWVMKGGAVVVDKIGQGD
jgi:imidazolonepropionase-like amidohydrolase